MKTKKKKNNNKKNDSPKPENKEKKPVSQPVEKKPTIEKEPVVVKKVEEEPKKQLKKKEDVKEKVRKYPLVFGLGKEKAYFVDNLSMLLSSGMGVSVALKSIEQDIRSKPMKKIVQYVREDIEAGISISKALEKSRLMSKHILALVRIGEESGQLDENLKLIAEQQEKDRLFRSRIRSAMLYPVLVIVVSLVAAVGISWFILPRFVGIFNMIDTEVPPLTKMLVLFGEIFVNHGSIIIPVFVFVMVAFLFFLFFYSRTKKAGQWLLYHMPLTKRIIQEIELSRFGYILGILLNAGLPVVEALDSLAEATTYYNFKKLFYGIRDDVTIGSSFLESFKKNKGSRSLVPISVQSMIESGERSGNLADILLRIGKSYEAKTELTTKSLTTILEPVLLIIIGVGVLILALGIITPIYGLIGGLR